MLQRLGAGSFGTVYKVRDEKGGWIEALKILGVDRLVGVDAENARKRFLREAQIMKNLGRDSPHIVGLSTYEEDLEAGLIYFLMEFVEGKSLADLVREEGPLPPERVLPLALQICDALTVAHEGPDPVVHRDLKLENLMLTRDRSGHEVVKVLDFGIAKIAEREADSRLTTVGTLGTPGYAAPEQLRAEPVDARTDLFAFGVILYSLLTGRDPWLGNPAGVPTTQIYELMLASDRGEARPMSETGVSVPPALEQVVMRLLRRDPDLRFQSARELKGALERILAGGGDVEASSLRVLTDPPGVEVEVRSGRRTLARGPTPQVVNGLAPGGYRVRVVDARFEPTEMSLSLGPGALEDVTVAVTPKKLGLAASLRRHTGRKMAGVVVLLALAGLAVVQPWGRALESEEALRLASKGAVRWVYLTAEGGLEGRLSVLGLVPAPFRVPVSPDSLGGLLRTLRNQGVQVFTWGAVAPLLAEAARAQRDLRYYGYPGQDVESYARRLLELDPLSPEGRSLLRKVAERMSWDAEDAQARGDPVGAQRLRERCRALVPEHPRCQP